jgi:cytochrome b561
MPGSSEDSRWTGASIGLHWLSFLVVAATGTIGLYMDGLPLGVAKLQVFALHKSLGLSVLALTVLRLLWRLASRAPPALPGAPAWQDRIARLTHAGLYALLLLVPLSGWWYNSTSGFALQYFKLFNVPALAATNLANKHQAKDVHELLFYLLCGLVALHAAAALGHHYLWRDRTLVRMLPGRRAARGATP